MNQRSSRLSELIKLLPAVDGTARQLGWVIAVAGCVGAAVQVATGQLLLEGHPAWWQAMYVVLAAAMLLLALGGLVLPSAALSVIFAAVPVGYAITALTCYLPAHQAAPIPLYAAPWAWGILPAAVSFLALILAPTQAIAVAIALGLLPGLSAFIFLGYLPAEIAWLMPGGAATAIWTLVAIGVRDGMVLIRESERRAGALLARELLANEEAERRQSVSVMVHDLVLSVLTGATSTPHTPSIALRNASSNALLALSAAASDADQSRLSVVRDPKVAAESITTGDARGWMERALRDADAEARVSFDSSTGCIPHAIIEAVVEASKEALRNSQRHCSSATHRSVNVALTDGWVEVVVTDDGGGFHLAEVPLDRMGVRRSIMGRMRQVGGRAMIDSVPGLGTSVVMSWPA